MSRYNAPIAILSDDEDFIGKHASTLHQPIIVFDDDDDTMSETPRTSVESSFSICAPIEATGTVARMAFNGVEEIEDEPIGGYPTEARSSTRKPETALKMSKADKEASKKQQQVQKALRKAAEKAWNFCLAEKEADRSFKKKLSAVNRLRTSKNEALREIKIYISADMSSPLSPIAGALPEIQARFQESLSEIVVMSDDDSPVTGLVRIKRHIKASWDVERKRFFPLDQPSWDWEPVVIVLAKAEELVDIITSTSQNLATWLADLRLAARIESTSQIIIVIQGMTRYQSATRTQTNREFTVAARAGLEGIRAPSTASRHRIGKEIIERALIELQICADVFLVHVESTEDLEDCFFNLCADVAIRPYKLLAKSHLAFAPGDKGRKSASSTGALELMLQEVQGITASAAAGIAAEFSTFAEIQRAFEDAEKRGGLEAAESLLADAEVRNLKNGTASGRRLGKALAKRVYNVFRGDDSLALA